MPLRLTSGLPVRRHSLLKRNPRLSAAEFGAHYENVHGPLASSQAGFRKYTTRYVQNHVLALPDGSQPAFDGCTQSTQLPRADYSKGFFTEPDYENVKEDEQYLFDISKTVSILGVESVRLGGEQTPFKALLLTDERHFDPIAFPGVVRIVVNQLDLSTASALGFDKGSFSQDALVELWFDRGQSRDNAVRAAMSAPATDRLNLLPVRELLIFGAEKPWRPA